MELANSLNRKSYELSHDANSDDELLHNIERQLAEIRQHIQHLQDNGQEEGFEMEWLALHLHLSVVRAMISDRLERMNQLTPNGESF